MSCPLLESSSLYPCYKVLISLLQGFSRRSSKTSTAIARSWPRYFSCCSLFKKLLVSALQHPMLDSHVGFLAACYMGFALPWALLLSAKPMYQQQVLCWDLPPCYSGSQREGEAALGISMETAQRHCQTLKTLAHLFPLYHNTVSSSIRMSCNSTLWVCRACIHNLCPSIQTQCLSHSDGHKTEHNIPGV